MRYNYYNGYGFPPEQLRALKEKKNPTYTKEELIAREEEKRRLREEKDEQIRERVVQFKKMKYMNYVDLARYIDMPQALMSKWVNQKVNNWGYKTTLFAWFQGYQGAGTCKYDSYDQLLNDMISFLDDVEAKNNKTIKCVKD